MMKTLKDIILEAKLGPEVAALANALKTSRDIFLDVDSDTINSIKSTFTKVADNNSKGRRWKIVIDNTFNGDTIMVALTTGEWRYQEKPKKTQEKKDEKILIENFQKYKDCKDFGPIIYTHDLLFLFRNFEKVDNPSSSWSRGFLYHNSKWHALRIDFNSKKWGFDNCSNPELMAKVSYTVAANINLPAGKERYHCAGEVVDYVKANFTKVHDYDETLDWGRIGWGTQDDSDIMVCLATKEYRGISWKDGDKSNKALIDKELNEIKTYKYGAFGLSAICHKYIRAEFTQSENSHGGIWHKVYFGDSKYGRYMINIEDKLWRKTTFDEFYGGAVVD
jgi:hypothetical protein